MFKDIGKLLKVAGQIKTKLPEVKAKLAAAEFSGTASPTGWELSQPAVRATVNGKMQIIDLEISPDLLANLNAFSSSDNSGEGTAVLVNLLKTAIADAQSKAAEAANQAMTELTGGVDLPGIEEML